jgi:hypothetical protein
MADKPAFKRPDLGDDAVIAPVASRSPCDRRKWARLGPNATPQPQQPRIALD